MLHLPAARLLRGITAVLSLLGLSLAALGLMLWRDPPQLSSALRLFIGAGGALAIVVAVFGPLRIALSRLLLPREIKHAMRVNGACVALGGVALVVASAHGSGHAFAIAAIVCAACTLGAAWAGLFALSSRLPASFTMAEMLGIARSARILGRPEDSVADREFRHWTGGSPAGVPLGARAPDGEVVTLDGSVTRLSEFFSPQGASATLVLNFGSYSCPHHRKRIDELHALMDRWQPRGVRFLTVYITEAHPEDGWRLEGQYAGDDEYTGQPTDFCFFHARDLADRRRMGQWLVDKKQFRMPVVMDSMDNTLMSAYNAWPIRLYVIHEDHIVFSGEQGPFGYDPSAVESALRKLH